MDRPILVGTGSGLWELRGETVQVEALAGRSVTALARDAAATWALVDGRTLWVQRAGHPWQERAAIDGPSATCLAPAPGGLIVGTEQAHLVRVGKDGLRRIDAFESVEGRDGWHTPWGDPADVRSIAVAAEGAIHVNVHVGGVVRSRDGGRSWAPTVDIESDVHQVVAHPTRAGVVVVAAAVGCGVSLDGGDSWQFVSAGLHARYLRAVAISGDTVLASASTGPRSHRAAMYRKPLDAWTEFARCEDGLPTWFADNIDTACLVAAGAVVVFGTEDGRVFRSLDAGQRWELAAKGLAPVTCVALA